MKHARRFGFGENWERFSKTVDEERVAKAEESLKGLLQTGGLEGMSFLDIGCGSGLFSLSAVRLGAAKILSFDYDPVSVSTTSALKDCFFKDVSRWRIERGDALDVRYLQSLGKFDIVYSWGVLHHTGDMWKALGNAAVPVKDGGILAIALYNDQGRRSVYWKIVKKTYNLLPGLLKYLVLVPCLVRLWARSFIRDLLRLQPMETWKKYRENRGMSPWHDLIDWVGGYPFEVAKPDDVIAFYRQRGFALRKLTTCGNGSGNNEFVFKREK